MLPRARVHLQSRAMPELPDLAILADALRAALAGRPVEDAAAPQPLVVRGTPGEMAALVGQRLVEVSRRGKFLTFRLERVRVVINPMLTGRLGLASPGARAWSGTATVLRFGARLVADEPASKGTVGAGERWPDGARWLPSDASNVELRYRDPTRMGKVYLVPADVERPLPGWDEQGPDADDPGLDLDAWRRRIRRHGGELKNLLRNQAFVAGIGNAYSDEILWAAQLLPFRKRATLADEEVDRLHAAMKEVLAWAIGELRERVPPALEVEVRDFLRVHRKGGRPCPRCGSRLSEVAPGGFVTTFCRTCQR